MNIRNKRPFINGFSNWWHQNSRFFFFLFPQSRCWRSHFPQSLNEPPLSFSRPFLSLRCPAEGATARVKSPARGCSPPSSRSPRRKFRAGSPAEGRGRLYPAFRQGPGAEPWAAAGPRRPTSRPGAHTPTSTTSAWTRARPAFASSPFSLRRKPGMARE